MYKSLVITVILFAAVSAVDVKFKDCGSQVGVIESISVEPCTKSPCRLPRGRNYTIGINFKSAENTPVVQAKVYGIVLGIKVPFPLPQPDGCLDSGVECPVQAGREYRYQATLPVLTSYPAVKCVVEWQLVDHKSAGNKLACAEFPIILV